MKRGLLAPNPPDRLADAWKEFLVAESVPHLQTDTRMHLPVFWLDGPPGRWLHVADEFTIETATWLRSLCGATQADGFLAVGVPSQGEIHLVVAPGVALDEGRRRVVALLRGVCHDAQ